MLYEVYVVKYVSLITLFDHARHYLTKIKVDSILKTNSELYDKQYLDTVLKDYNYYTQNV